MQKEIDDYLNGYDMGELSPLSKKTYRFHLENFARYAQSHGVVDLADYRDGIAEKWIASLVERSGKYREQAFRTVRRFLEHNEIEITMGKIRSIPQDIPHPLTVKELKAILKRTQGETKLDRRDTLILEIMGISGLRASEVCDLNLDSLQSGSNFIRVRGKGGKERVVPMLPRMTTDLIAYTVGVRPAFLPHDDRALFLGNTGRRLTRSGIYHMVEVRCFEAGIKRHIHPHIFRHTAATILLESGAGIRQVQEILGHSSVQTTTIYTHLDKRLLRKRIQKSHPRDARKDLLSA